LLTEAVSGRYVRLHALSEVNNNPWTSAAEINVLGVTGEAILAIDPDTAQITIGESLNLSAVGGDEPYAFDIVHDCSGCTLTDHGNGTATYIAGTACCLDDIVRVTDGNGAEAEVVITVTGCEEIFPETPAPISPEDEEIVYTLTPSFEWSFFQDGGDSETQAGYQLRVLCDGCGSGGEDTTVYDTGFIPDTSGSAHIYTPGAYTGYDNVTGVNRVSDPLEWGKHYHWHVRYCDSGGDWSGWSADDGPGSFQDFHTMESSDIAKDNWSILYTDSEETNVVKDLRAVNAIDDNPATIWHTEWKNADPVCPHELWIDMGHVYSISGFGYLPRQDGSPNGRIAEYKFYVSVNEPQNADDWGDPVCGGVFANNASEKEALLTEIVPGRYIRLQALSEVNNNPWASAAEINVLGVINAEP